MWEDLISFCTGYGASYNPNKPTIQLTALNTLHTTAAGTLTAVNTAFTPWSNAVGAREIVFEPLSKLITRVVNALEASDVPPPADPAAPAEDASNNVSASQMSFDNRIDNMDKLIGVLVAQSGYAPNETELTTASLTTLAASMRTTNTAVTNAYTPLSNTRIDRDRVLYQDETGLVDIAGDVKNYVKSVFGASSPQYKQISGLKFVKVENK